MNSESCRQRERHQQQQKVRLVSAANSAAIIYNKIDTKEANVHALEWPQSTDAVTLAVAAASDRAEGEYSKQGSCCVLKGTAPLIEGQVWPQSLQQPVAARTAVGSEDYFNHHNFNIDSLPEDQLQKSDQLTDEHRSCLLTTTVSSVNQLNDLAAEGLGGFSGAKRRPLSLSLSSSEQQKQRQHRLEVQEGNEVKRLEAARIDVCHSSPIREGDIISVREQRRVDVSNLCQRPAIKLRRRRTQPQFKPQTQTPAQPSSCKYQVNQEVNNSASAEADTTFATSSVPFDQHWRHHHQLVNKQQASDLCIDGNEDEGGHVIIDSNSTFWRRLSNLSRSITQRNNSNSPPITSSYLDKQQENFLHRNSLSKKDFAKDQEQQQQVYSNQLAPEVVGYLTKLKQQFVTCSNRREFRRIDLSKSIAEMTVVASAAGAPAEPSGGATSVAADASGADQQQLAGSGDKLTQSENQNNNNNNEEKRLIKIVELPATPTTTTSQLTHEDTDQQQLEGQLKLCQDHHSQSERQYDQLDGNLTHKHKAHHHHHHHVKLSITTTNTTTTNNTASTHSSVSSLSSCILSESTSTSEVRLRWGKKMDFLLSIIGFAVDLANIWRFPYLVYKNGGGVFLIPYLAMLIFGGIPLFFLELCLGQFVKKGPITVWNKICPYMKGVGYCSILISWYVSFYYNVLIAWSVYFIYRSISSIGNKMPWEDCDNSWNSKGGTCVSISQLKSLCSVRNETLEVCRRNMFSSVNVTSPASEFFVKELSQIDQSSGLDDMGYLRPELVACTIIVYILHYFSLFRGLETSGKVVWVTATAPYMILSILLVRGLFLPGASMGIEYYLSPKMEKLADPQVWIDAAGQVFYSIGVGFGVHLTYASFNSHDNNCYRDCLMTSAVNALTSVYSGLVVFVYLGYMASNLGIEIDKVASEGYSLVFEVYPEALTTLPFARFWSILFFIMLLTLGIDSAMGGLEAVITGLEDEFKFAKRLSRSQLTGLVIVSSFLPALISCTQGGAYTLFWFDIYSAGVSLLFSALFETIGVVYCYGLDKFILNIESMLGRRPGLFYILCWKYISPTFLVGIIFMSIYTASVPVYRGYTFPLWSIVLGWCLAFSSVAAIPIVALLTWCRRGSTGRALNTPSKSPRKLRAASGIDSVTSGGTRKSPSHHHHQQPSKTSTDCNQTMTTAIITSSQGEHPHRHYTRVKLNEHGGGEKFREHML